MNGVRWSLIEERLRRWRRKVFFWLPSAGSINEETPSEPVHDHSLVIAVTSPERIPKWKQVRHMFRLLSPNERRIFIGAGLATLAFLVIAFGAFTSQRIITVPVSGGTYTEALIGQPKYLNPLDAGSNDVDRDLVRLIYSGLFRFENTEAVPDLADAATWSADHKTLTVKLRKDIRFHDNEPLTSEDVRFTIDSIKDPDRKSPLLAEFHGITVSTPDAETVVFTLEKPDGFLLEKLTVGILPAHIWQEVPSSHARLSDVNIRPIGSGPYRIKSFLRDNVGSIRSYTLERVDGNAAIQPYLKTLVFQFFADQKSALDALKTDLVNGLAFVPTEEVKNLGSSGRLHRVTMELPQETVAFFQTKDQMFANADVRRALAAAVRREDILTDETDSAIAVHGPFPFESSTGTTPDLEAARSLLTKTGWVLPTDGNIRIWQPPKKETTKPNKPAAPPKAAAATNAVATSTASTASASTTEFALTISFPDDPDLTRIAEQLKRSWSLLGARVTLEPLSSEDLMRRATRDRSLQIVLLNVLLGPSQDIFPFWWSGQAAERGLNISNYRDRDLDQALENIRDATSTLAIHAARSKAATILFQSVPALFLSRPVHAYLLSQDIKGVPDRLRTLTPAERFQSIASWYVNTGWRWK